MNKIQAINGQDNYVGAGFHRLGKGLVHKKAPKIKWGIEYVAWPPERKISYLEKLAASMNHAAFLIQNERNDIMELLIKKEQQIVSMKKALGQNNTMIQEQITAMNAERQKYNAAIVALKAELREAGNGDHG